MTKDILEKDQALQKELAPQKKTHDPNRAQRRANKIYRGSAKKYPLTILSPNDLRRQNKLLYEIEQTLLACQQHSSSSDRGRSSTSSCPSSGNDASSSSSAASSSATTSSSSAKSTSSAASSGSSATASGAENGVTNGHDKIKNHQKDSRVEQTTFDLTQTHGVVAFLEEVGQRGLFGSGRNAFSSPSRSKSSEISLSTSSSNRSTCRAERDLLKKYRKPLRLRAHDCALSGFSGYATKREPVPDSSDDETSADENELVTVQHLHAAVAFGTHRYRFRLKKGSVQELDDQHVSQELDDQHATNMLRDARGRRIRNEHDGLEGAMRYVDALVGAGGSGSSTQSSQGAETENEKIDVVDAKPNKSKCRVNGGDGTESSREVSYNEALSGSVTRQVSEAVCPGSSSSSSSALKKTASFDEENLSTALIKNASASAASGDGQIPPEVGLRLPETLLLGAQDLPLRPPADAPSTGVADEVPSLAEERSPTGLTRFLVGLTLEARELRKSKETALATADELESAKEAGDSAIASEQTTENVMPEVEEQPAVVLPDEVAAKPNSLFTDPEIRPASSKRARSSGASSPRATKRKTPSCTKKSAFNKDPRLSCARFKTKHSQALPVEFNFFNDMGKRPRAEATDGANHGENGESNSKKGKKETESAMSTMNAADVEQSGGAAGEPEERDKPQTPEFGGKEVRLYNNSQMPSSTSAKSRRRDQGTPDFGAKRARALGTASAAKTGIQKERGNDEQHDVDASNDEQTGSLELYKKFLKNTTEFDQALEN